MSDFTVALLGEPNVGKSSLINALVGENVSIVTDMAGTTRDQIRGFADFEFGRVTFLDAPGMLKNKMDGMLAKHMSKSISLAVSSADVICYVLDAVTFGERDIRKIENYRDSKPVIVVVNKIDKMSFETLYPKLAALGKLDFVTAVITTSAINPFTLIDLKEEITKLMPKDGRAKPAADNDDYTDQSAKKMSEEIIRAAIIRHVRAEIPHGVAISIESWKENSSKIEITCDIICEKPSHKPILIGKSGSMLKQIGSAARIEIESLTGKHVNLQTHVFVRDNWKNSKSMLDKLGYNNR